MRKQVLGLRPVEVVVDGGLRSYGKADWPSQMINRAASGPARI